MESGAVPAFIVAPTLTPRVTASSEISGMQMAFEGTINGSQSILQRDQGGVAGNNVYNRFEAFTDRPFPVTAGAAIALFLDDDNNDAPIFYNVSMGFLGPDNAMGVRTWLDIDDTLPPAAFTDNGPAPSNVADTPLFWGKEAEASSLAKLIPAFYVGGTNYSDWYYPSTGLLLGNNSSVGGADLGLDTSALSLPVAEGGRGRSDIVNQTQARNIDIPVIAFGGSNGLAPIPAAYRGFASSIGTCTADSCDGNTARILPGQAATDAFPTFGGVDGGFEVFINEGYSHLDVLTANDDETNQIIAPLMAFIERNIR